MDIMAILRIGIEMGQKQSHLGVLVSDGMGTHGILIYLRIRTIVSPRYQSSGTTTYSRIPLLLKTAV